MYRGGNWNNGANAGVFYLNGNNSRTNSNTNIGFRVALALFVHCLRATAQQKHRGKRGMSPGRKAKDKRPLPDTGAIGNPRRLADPVRRERTAGPFGVAAAGSPDAPRIVTPRAIIKTKGGEAMQEGDGPSILERIYSWENLLNAYHEAASDKWYRTEVASFSAHLEENLISIQNDLIWRTYKVGRYREFYVSEPKKRLIMALGFRDRVVQWAIYLQINDQLDNSMIFHSYGCRVGKGTTRAAEKLLDWCSLVDRKPGRWRYLKLDVSKYFYRVDHEVLLGIIAKKYPDEDGLLWLMRTIVCCDHTPFGLPPGKSADEVPPTERLFEVGMPIGNLTSQMLANVCLNELDQFIKHELHAHYFVRYMDDMVLLHPDAKTLNEWRDRIEEYLNTVLHLELNSKTTIGLVKCGITFVGFRIRPGYMKMTPKAVKKMKARMGYIAGEYGEGLIDYDAANATMQSYFGLMGHAATHGLQKWIANNIKFQYQGAADNRGEVLP